MTIPVSDLVGVPFRRGGFDPATGLDCLGLVLEVFRRAGVPVHVDFDYSRGWRARVLTAFEEHVGQFEAVPARLARSGDLVVMDDEPGEPLHVGVMISRTDVIHSTKTAGVAVQRLARFADRSVRVLRHVE